MAEDSVDSLRSLVQISNKKEREGRLVYDICQRGWWLTDASALMSSIYSTNILELGVLQCAPASVIIAWICYSGFKEPTYPLIQPIISLIFQPGLFVLKYIVNKWNIISMVFCILSNFSRPSSKQNTFYIFYIFFRYNLPGLQKKQ